MQLTTNIDIEEGVVTANIKCTDISDETKIVSNKIYEAELTTSLSRVEILSKAKALIWVEKIKAEIKRLVEEAREQNAANIEGTTEEIV